MTECEIFPGSIKCSGLRFPHTTIAPMKYSLRTLMIVVTLAPPVLALFLLGWRYAVPREARIVADAAGICTFSFNALLAFVTRRRAHDGKALPYAYLNLIPAAALALDLVIP